VSSFCHIYGSERQIEVVFEFDFAGALAAGQSGKLFGISEDGLNLETQGISLQNPRPVFFGVGTEKCM